MNGNGSQHEVSPSAVSATVVHTSSILKIKERNQPLIVKQSFKRTANLLFNSKKLETFNCSNYMPFLGYKLDVIQTSKDKFKLKSSGDYNPFAARLVKWEPKSGKSITLTREQAIAFLRSLKVCQLVLKAVYCRTGNQNERCLISTDLLKAMEALDETVQGRLGSSEQAMNQVRSSAQDLENLYVKRINQFNESVDENSVQSRDKFDSFQLSQTKIVDFESIYINWSGPSSTTPSRYLEEAPCQEVDFQVRASLSDALKRLFVFPKTDDDLEESSLYSDNSYTYNQPKLFVAKDLDNPFESILDLCKTIEPYSADLTPNDSIILKQIKSNCEDQIEHLTIKAMLHPQENPRVMKEQIHNLMLENSLEEAIKLTLQKELPGIYDNTDAANYPEKLRDTSNLRGNLNSLNDRLKRMDRQLEVYQNAKDMQYNYAQDKKELHKLQEKLASARKASTVDEVQRLLEDLREEIETFEEGVQSETETAESLSSSVFWVGLGQGGCQILRECLLYCMDNVNDARAGSLLSALGLDSSSLISKMKDRNGKDPEVKRKAEEELTQICDRYLRVLAVNIGTDIDRLVMQSSPGHFLWGKKYDDPAGSNVDRKTSNTLRLDKKMGGAGGSTGLGRAFGFARSGEIEKILRDVGRKNSRKNPSHVIITHSYAGGSGSGMTLPILQHIRKSFDPDTVIWVMSVGEGDSEDRDQAVYNTPFIISDILQAHYDGIHSPMDPVLPGQWTIFRSDIKRNHEDLSNILTEILDLVGADVQDGKVLQERYLRALPSSVEIEKRKSDLERLRQGLGEYREYKQEDEIGTLDYSKIDSLVKILPEDVTQTNNFNDWCEKFEDEGSRPALNFWQSWVECASDPIGTFVSGREIVKSTQVESASEDGRRQDFMPSLSEKDLAKVMSQLNRDFEVITTESNSEIDEVEIERSEIPSSLDPLYQMLRAGLIEKQDRNSRNEYINQLKSKFMSYKNILKGYNSQRRRLTRQIRALTGSSNDERVKNIIISNGHLERGVASSSVKVADNSYTVFNSVIFDLILNIIGSQMPSSGNYMTTAAEEFDEQDLIQHTKSPLAVGLFEHRDSLSLNDRSLAFRGKEDFIGKAINKLFMNEELWDGKPNPMYCASQMGGIKYLENALFGTKALSMLQNNPYEATRYVYESEEIKLLVNDIEERWNSDEDLLGFTKFDRTTVEKERGFTSLHLGNIIRWISAIDESVLPYLISPLDPRSSNPRDSKEKSVKQIKDKLSNWSAYLPISQPYDDTLSKNSRELDDFLEESGLVDLEQMKSLLPKLGIWNDRMLRSLPPSYVNTYLPPLILEEALSKLGEGTKEKKIIQTLINFNIWSYDNKLHGNYGSIEKRENLINEVLEPLDLQFIMWTEKTNKGEVKHPILRLHPKIQRYFAAMRTLPVNNGDYFLPARSTAGILPRYLMANNVKHSVDDYSIPTFKQAASILNWHRYIGLLPDESRFEWPALLRMLLLVDSDFDNLENRLKHLSSIMGIDLNNYKEEIELVLSAKYSTSGLNSFKIPSEIWDQMTVLQRRIIHSIPLAQKMLTNTPTSWRDSRDGLEYWIKFVGLTGLVGEDAPPEDFKYEDSEDVESNILQFQLVLNETVPPSESPDLDFSEPIHHIRRLVYDVMTYMREALLQAIYQSSNSNHERVHFEMTGFSDIISGMPGGLLCLIHDKGTKMDKGQVQGNIRSNVHHSLGYISTNKEFSTSSRFGPNATSTLVMMNAPINEAARQFSLAMDRLTGTSKFHYLNKTKLHPYVFLYNLLWLPTNIERWIPADNEDYIRRFQIPLEVIESHYSDPETVINSREAVQKEQAFKMGNLDLPDDDIRDFENVKKNGDYRNIINLIGIMALRHNHNSNDDLWKGIIEKQEFDDLTKRRGRSGGLISKKCLEPLTSSGNISTDDDPWGEFDDNESDDENESVETIESRGIAWFIAYKKWLDYSKPESAGDIKTDYLD